MKVRIVIALLCVAVAAMAVVLFQPRRPRRVPERRTTEHLTPLTEVELDRLVAPARPFDEVIRDMVYVPSGPFLMGADGGDLSERPSREVYVDGFYMDRTEVTNEQYQRFVDAVGHRVPRAAITEHGGYEWVNGRYREGMGRHPVVLVSWEDALAYALWAGKRLPTEAEWEKAARGTDGRKWPWGNTWDPKKCNSSQSGNRGTTPVGSYPEGASPYGCLDMAGNVLEWCLDPFHRDYYSRMIPMNPQGPEGGVACVLRSGSWTDWNVHCSNRARGTPAHRLTTIGFRCALTAPAERPGTPVPPDRKP